MKVKDKKLWLHLLLVLAVFSLMVVGCEDEDAVTAPTKPVQTQVPSPTPSHTDAVTPTPTEEVTPTVKPTITPTETPEISDTPEPEDTEEAPPLPPPFGLDSNVFSSVGDTVLDSDVAAQGFVLASFDSSNGAQPIAGLFDRTNWNHAAGNVLIWSGIVVIGLAVPVAAFVASFQNIPYRDNDGVWIWDYDVNIAGIKHSAELRGEYITEGVRWEMRISKEGHYSDFLWYYGEGNREGTEGYWIMMKSPTEQRELLRIDWKRSLPADGTGEIKYTNIEPGGKENGGYILTRTTNDTPFDMHWDIYNKGQDNHTIIEWNRSTEEGRVKDAKKFGDGNWHCWDVNHDNIDCP